MMTPEQKQRVRNRLASIEKDVNEAQRRLDDDNLESFGAHIDNVAEDLLEIQQMFGGAA